MEFDSSPLLLKGQVYRVGPLILDDQRLVVVDGRYVRASIRRESLFSIKIEKRTSFKHPIVGLIVGAAFIGVPLGGMILRPDDVGPFFFGGLYPIAGTLFLVMCGCFLIYGAVTRRDAPWLVVNQGPHERAIYLGKRIGDDVTIFVEQFSNSIHAALAEKQKSRPAVRAERL